jgi:Zn-dependent peptidase ImmA (M78 family)/transcriptional regulator with XRE-family HTH domain
MTPAHLAARLGKHFKAITPELIERWEDGTAEPTPRHIKKLAEIYKRPVAVFLLAQPPDENPLPPDRRTLSHRRRVPFSAATLLIIRRARLTQQVARELIEDSGTPLCFRYEYEKLSVADPTSLATRIRADLGISSKDQFRFRTYADFFQYLRERLESTGILTLRSGGHQRFPLDDARALSFTDDQPYVILINNADTEGAKNFSLLHEFAHILLREAGICTNFTAFTSQHGTVDTLEVFCNQFAADFLVPKADFLAHPLLRGHNRLALDQLNSIASPLARAFKVSRFVILRRLLATELISRDTYNAKATEWESEHPPERPGGKSVPSRTALLNAGFTFSRLVIQAYKSDRLSSAAASECLGIKSKHIPAFAKLIQAYERQSLH